MDNFKLSDHVFVGKPKMVQWSEQLKPPFIYKDDGTSNMLLLHDMAHSYRIVEHMIELCKSQNVYISSTAKPTLHTICHICYKPYMLERAFHKFSERFMSYMISLHLNPNRVSPGVTYCSEFKSLLVTEQFLWPFFIDMYFIVVKV
jgi:hypothetical protein